MQANSGNILNKPTNLSLNANSYKPDYKGVPSQALDAVRMRLAQLTHSLRKIRDDLSKAELPQWYSLQSQLNVTLTQLMSVTSTLEHFHDTLDSTVVYPLPKFPTTSHETLLTTLLRKKYTPEVDEWIKEAQESSGLDPSQLNQTKIKRVLQKDKDCTKWALDTFSAEFEKYDFKGLKTKKEQESEDMMETDYVPTAQTYKPSDAFVVEDVLNFVYRGEDKENTSDEKKEIPVTN